MSESKLEHFKFLGLMQKWVHLLPIIFIQPSLHKWVLLAGSQGRRRCRQTLKLTLGFDKLSYQDKMAYPGYPLPGSPILENWSYGKKSVQHSILNEHTLMSTCLRWLKSAQISTRRNKNYFNGSFQWVFG